MHVCGWRVPVEFTPYTHFAPGAKRHQLMLRTVFDFRDGWSAGW